MFALSGLLSDPRPLREVPSGADGPDLRDVASMEVRFPARGVNALRLPKDPSGVRPAMSGGGRDGALLWTALTDATVRIPLVEQDGVRRAALLAAVDPGGPPVLAAAVVAVRPGATRHAPAELASVGLRQADDIDAMLDMLAALHAEADPAARAAATGADAVWLGGNLAQQQGALAAVQGAGACMGLRVEIVPDVHRRARQVGVRLAGAPPEYLIVWRPQAHGAEPAVDAYRAASAEGEVVVLDEPALPDALLEFRYALVDLGLADAEGPPSDDPAGEAPAAGEERFYVKTRGSKVGDVMASVADCGHGRWGSDVRRLAPRAWKGIAAGEGGAVPKALFRCALCKKHRWRARY